MRTLFNECRHRPPRLWTVDDVMAYLQVGRWWVYSHRAEIGGCQVGGLLRFRPADVQAYVDRGRPVRTVVTPTPAPAQPAGRRWTNQLSDIRAARARRAR